LASVEDEFTLVIIVQYREGVDGSFERFFAFGITGNLAYDELVEQFRLAFRAELERRKD
jgi:hypothetical protein